MRRYKIFVLSLFSLVVAQNNFLYEDVNPLSDTYGQHIGPSYFNNTLRVIGFFHEY